MDSAIRVVTKVLVVVAVNQEVRMKRLDCGTAAVFAVAKVVAVVKTVFVTAGLANAGNIGGYSGRSSAD